MKRILLILILLFSCVGILHGQVCQTNTQYIRSALSPEPILEFRANPSWITFTTDYYSQQQISSSATGYSIPLDTSSDSVWVEFATRTPSPFLQHVQLIMIRDVNGVTRFLISYDNGNIVIYAGCNFECRFDGTYLCEQTSADRIPTSLDNAWHHWKVQFVRGTPSGMYVWLDGKRIYTNTSFNMSDDAYMMTAVGIGYYVAGNTDLTQPYLEWQHIKTYTSKPKW